MYIVNEIVIASTRFRLIFSLLGMCVLVYLQSTPVLGWMVVG